MCQKYTPLHPSTRSTHLYTMAHFSYLEKCPLVLKKLTESRIWYPDAIFSGPLEEWSSSQIVYMIKPNVYLCFDAFSLAFPAI